MPQHDHSQHDIVTCFGKTNFRNQEAVFGIKTDDRRRHMYVIGKTGMGKTNMLENLAIQDIRNGHGVAFIDPHGDSAEKLISMIPPERINDVIYFNPCDRDFPISFNVMERVAPEHRPLVASGLVGVFQKLWADSWGPRLEYILRNAILALLEYPGSTLLGVMRILVDPKYRKRVTDKITDPVVRAFWVDEFPKWNERVLQEVISPIQNKVGQFLTSPLVRNVVGQTTSSFSVRTAMDENKILILNLSKGRIGEDNSALIGAMMITKIQLAAMGRVDTPEEERKDFYLYVDEFQNFATESFANILSEARKYRLNLILANQYIAQIDELVRDAIFGNAGSIVAFRVGAADAEYLEKEFEPVFMMNDIVNLEKYCIYLKLMIDGIAGDAFSAATLPPIERLHPDSTDTVVKVSRERYSQGREEVERKIAQGSGMALPEAEQANVRVIKKEDYQSSASTAPIAHQQEPEAPRHRQADQNFKAIKVRRIKAVGQEVQEAEAVQEAQEIQEAQEMQEAQTTQTVITAKTQDSTQETKKTAAPKKNKQKKNLRTEVALSAPVHASVASSPSTHTSTKSSSLEPAAAVREKIVTAKPEEDAELYAAQQQQAADAQKPERVLYEAACDSCGDEITVPFQPDGKRPTYCKECLKDYQRMKAQKKEPQTPKNDHTPSPRTHHKQPQTDAVQPVATVADKIYAPQEKPMKLSQMNKIAPKKFGKSTPKGDKKIKVDLEGIRGMIDEAQGKDYGAAGRIDPI